MTQTKVLIAVILLIGVACTAETQSLLRDGAAKESYSLGYQFGEFLRNNGIAINLDAYNAGIEDALGKDNPAMTKEEIRATVKVLQQRVADAQQKARQEQAASNLVEGEKFLAENKKKNGIKALPSGLQYRVIREGSGPVPKASDKVTVHYRGTLIDGTEFDSTKIRGAPATFQTDQVIPGWIEALQLMKAGSKWELFIPPHLGYGEQGASRMIPPNSTLIFEIELISVQGH